MRYADDASGYVVVPPVVSIARGRCFGGGPSFFMPPVLKSADEKVKRPSPQLR